ncbi:MAG: hypothetical protein KatS3mg077_2043 [Candidatus Binatia bacterium]|nr:MAG: hypothetical protein KatS3mg077_2043 [Candidatus Binatia bacterium]
MKYRKPGWLTRRGNDSEDPLVDRQMIQNEVAKTEDVAALKGRYDWFVDVQNKLKEKVEKLEALSRRLDDWCAAFGESAPAGSDAETSEDKKPFTLTLPPSFVKSQSKREVPAEQLLRELREKGLAALLDNPAETLNGVMANLQYSSLDDWLRQVAKLPEGHELRSAVQHILRELNQLSAPAWDYQEAWVSNPHVAERESVNIIGLENGSDGNPALLSEPFFDILAGNIHDKQKLRAVRTGQPNHVYLYKIEASIPAFILRNIEMYRERYRDFSEERSFHVDRVLEAQLPELFPLPSEEEAIQVWVKARLFCLVEKDSQTQEFRCEGVTINGGARWHNLGRTLAEAYNCLKNDFFLFRELRFRVEEQEKSWREKRADYKKRVEAALAKRATRLEELKQSLDADSASDWLKKEIPVVEQEIRVLETLQSQIATLPPDLGTDVFVPPEN